MAKSVGILVVGLLAGGLVAYAARSLPESEGGAVQPAAQELERLAARVAELEALVAELPATTTAATADSQPEVAHAEVDELTQQELAAAANVVRQPAGRRTATDRRARQREFLARRGLNDDEIDAIFSFESARQLRELDVDWERRREAYVNGEQDRSTATSYFDELRAAVGDETFERYLNAQGLGLNVASIIPGTAAEYAGLQAGDVVQNYNGQRVFTADQLNALTVAGARGESVSIDVLRDGQTVTVTIPRGPIGIQTGGRRRGR